MQFFSMIEPPSNDCYRAYYILKQLINDDIKASKQYKSMMKKLIDLANEKVSNSRNVYSMRSKLQKYLGETASTLLTYEYFKPIEDSTIDIDIDDIEQIEHINWFGDGNRGIECRKQDYEYVIKNPDVFKQPPEIGTKEYFERIFGKPNKRNYYIFSE